MRLLTAFISVSLDGFFADAAGDMSWAHKDPGDVEWNEFTSSNAQGGGALVFGRVTYEMMAGFWPTKQAMESMPAVAQQMNSLPKIVFSRTLEQATWNNTRLIRGDLATETRKLKQEPGPDMTILGSGSIVAQLAQHGLIDELQIVVNPLVLGKGKPLFAGVQEKLPLKLKKSRTFGNGSVLLCYAPAA